MSDCIETTWWCNEDGYGQRNSPRDAEGKQKTLRHHREVMRELHVPIAGMVVRHHCDNPPCVNPDHLTVGTDADNMRDREERGRTYRPIGEKHHQAKLTEYAVRWIRTYYATGDYTQQELGEMFGVTPSHIGYIVNRKTWAHVK